MEKLVYAEGRSDLLRELALVYVNTGLSLMDRDRSPDGEEYVNKSIRILEMLITYHQRYDLQETLNLVMENLAKTRETHAD